MANPLQKVSANVPGEFFVDSTCINCDACRQLAPGHFEDAGRTSAVVVQPETPDQIRAATRALLACPTGSIGTIHPNQAAQVTADFPLPLAENIFYCGFNSPQSFGGNSYFIRHPQGNWLVDSPKFLPPLVRRFEQEGGLSFIFLTHQDDVADAAKYAEHFKSRRIIHEADQRAQRDAEMILKGAEPVEPVSGFKIIPTPGHTKGHCVLLFQDQFLFTGDHLWWRRKRNQLGAGRDVAWYSWEEQIQSMEKLLKYDFEWVLPGHGQRAQRPAPQMKEELKALIQRMKKEA